MIVQLYVAEATSMDMLGAVIIISLAVIKFMFTSL